MAVSTWLGPFVATNLNAALEWKKQKDNGIKHEHIEGQPRFSDDGSNLRIHFPSVDKHVHITKWQRQLYHLADDSTSIRARFTNDARHRIPTNISVGDVLKLESFEISATHLGPPAGKIQLVIHKCSLSPSSRTLNIQQLQPFHQREDAKVFLRRLNRYRAPDTASASPPVQPSPSLTNPLPAGTGPLRSASPDMVEVSAEAWNSQRTPTPRKRPRSEISPQLQASPVSQRSVKPRREREDGDVVVQTGVNLVQPRQIVSNFHNEGAQLLGLIGRAPTANTLAAREQARQAALQLAGLTPAKTPSAQLPSSRVPSAHAPSARMLPPPIPAPEQPTQASQSQPMLTQFDVSSSHAIEPVLTYAPVGPPYDPEPSPEAALVPTQREPMGSTPTSAQPQPGPRSPQKHPQLFVPDKPGITSLSVSDTSSSQLIEKMSSVATPGAAYPFERAPPMLYTKYARRRIPKDQRRLLERSDAWLPARPGTTFPHPNIPVDLLTRLDEITRRPSLALKQPEVPNEAVEPTSDDLDGSSAVDWTQSPPRDDPPLRHLLKNRPDQSRFDAHLRTNSLQLPPDSSTEGPLEENKSGTPSSLSRSTTSEDSDDWQLDEYPSGSALQGRTSKGKGKAPAEDISSNLRRPPEYSLSSSPEDARNSQNSVQRPRISDEATNPDADENRAPKEVRAADQEEVAGQQIVVVDPDTRMNDLVSPALKANEGPNVDKAGISEQGPAQADFMAPVASMAPSTEPVVPEIEVVETPLKPKRRRRRFDWSSPPPKENPQTLWHQWRREKLPRLDKRDEKLDAQSEVEPQTGRHDSEFDACIPATQLENQVIQTMATNGVERDQVTAHENEAPQEAARNSSADVLPAGSLGTEGLLPENTSAEDAPIDYPPANKCRLEVSPQYVPSMNGINARSFQPSNLHDAKDSLGDNQAEIDAQAGAGDDTQAQAVQNITEEQSRKPTTTLWVVGIFNVDETDLSRHFAAFHPISVVVPPDDEGHSRGVAIVKFLSIGSASEAWMFCKRTPLKGEWLKCDFVQPTTDVFAASPPHHEQSIDQSHIQNNATSIDPKLSRPTTSASAIKPSPVEHVARSLQEPSPLPGSDTTSSDFSGAKPTLETLHKALVKQRQYGGNLKAMSNMCKKLYLQFHSPSNLRAKVPQVHWDNYVVLQSSRYPAYMQRCISDGEDFISYEQYWQDQLQDYIAPDRSPLITPAKLDAIFSFEGNDRSATIPGNPTIPSSVTRSPAISSAKAPDTHMSDCGDKEDNDQASAGLHMSVSQLGAGPASPVMRNLDSVRYGTQTPIQPSADEVSSRVPHSTSQPRTTLPPLEKFVSGFYRERHNSDDAHFTSRSSTPKHSSRHSSLFHPVAAASNPQLVRREEVKPGPPNQPSVVGEQQVAIERIAQKSTTDRVSEVSSARVDDIARLKEPERASEWLREMYLTDPDSSVLQSEIWNAYKETFMESRIAVLTPISFIRHIRQSFPNTHHLKVEKEGDAAKFFIKGIRSRNELRSHQSGTSPTISAATRALADPSRGLGTKDISRSVPAEESGTIHASTFAEPPSIPTGPRLMRERDYRNAHNAATKNQQERRRSRSPHRGPPQRRPAPFGKQSYSDMFPLGERKELKEDHVEDFEGRRTNPFKKFAQAYRDLGKRVGENNAFARAVQPEEAQMKKPRIRVLAWGF